MGNYSDAKSSIRCFSKASVSLFGIGFSKTSSRKLHRNLHHRKYDKAVLACFRSVQIKACEKIHQGEPSLAKFLKNLLFWTFWPAKSSKTTLFEKIPQGESSLAKFLKNLLFWTSWLAKSSKTTFFEKIHQDQMGLAPMYSFVQKLSLVASKHGLEPATPKSDVFEKPSDFNLMTCLFRGV